MKVEILVPLILSGTGQSFVEGPHHVGGIQLHFPDEGSECFLDFWIRHSVEDHIGQGQKQAHLDARIMAGSPRRSIERGEPGFHSGDFFPAIGGFPSVGYFSFSAFHTPEKALLFPREVRSMSGCRMYRPHPGTEGRKPHVGFPHDYD